MKPEMNFGEKCRQLAEEIWRSQAGYTDAAMWRGCVERLLLTSFAPSEWIPIENDNPPRVTDLPSRCLHAPTRTPTEESEI
jgi:hypothetical protein